MKKAKKTWREKLSDDKNLPKVAKVHPRQGNRWGLKPGDTMILPTPREVDGLMKRIPPGRLATIRDLQQALARKHGTTTACPIVTGIFAWIAAHAAEEDRAAGRKRITPYWRTLKGKGEINAKYPGGAAGCAKRLRDEGHGVVKRGARYFVDHFERQVMQMSTGRPAHR